MAVRPIVRLGHPALRTPAEPLTAEQLATPGVQALIDDLFDTMIEAGGVGLAAPQVDEPVQLFVYLAVDARGEQQAEPQRRVLVNPMLEPLGGELIYDWEGCLSIPDLRGLVPRHPEVRVHALDRHGERLTFRAEGYEARIVQHEFDHLNGVVFLDRMRDLHSLAFSAEWEAYMVAADDEAAVG
ncbi:MAG: peptide deformylase [Acidobacteria bacterium]|nr:MAG: peptide deformylase [Acidobacteriota bacterium]